MENSMSETEQEIPMLPAGCGYRGREFGANYLDSECFGGQLYDMDNCDDDGLIYEPCEYLPCPNCRMEEWLESMVEHIGSGLDGGVKSSLPAWKTICRYALKTNRDEAIRLLTGRFRAVTYVEENAAGDDFIERQYDFDVEDF